MTRLRFSLGVWVCIAILPLQAQTGGFLTGMIRERSGTPLPGAEIRCRDQLTGTRQALVSEGDGQYRSGEMASGTYKVTVRSPGFRTLHQAGITVIAGRTRAVDFVMDVLPVQQEMTVESGPANLDDPDANEVTVSRGSPQSRLPSNGRDLHALFAIMPGAVTTPASLGDGGQFTVGGQRPNANTFRVDGISGNSGLGLVAISGSSPGATLPGMTTIGSTQSLVAKEETERVELRSFDFSAGGGERPGALVAVQTRAGTNDFHGSFFGYLRPRSLDSQDWFAEQARYALTPAALHGWGGSFDGAIWPRHTFFFASIEKLAVQDTAYQLLALPTLQTRAQAPFGIQAFLNAFPLPTGRALNNTMALGGSALLKNAHVANYGIRIDQNIGSRIRVFARYSDVPSSSTSLEIGTANSSFSWLNGTVGISIATKNTSHEIRFNTSQATAESEHVRGFYSDRADVSLIQNFFAGTNLTNYESPFFGPSFSGTVTALSLGGVGQALSGQSGQSVQHQYEGTDTSSFVDGRHTAQVGGDFIALRPSVGVRESSLAVAAPSLDALLRGQPLSLSTYEVYPNSYYSVLRAAAFAQDTFRVSERLSLNFGVRWEITPPVSTYNFDIFQGYFNAGQWLGVGTTPNVSQINTDPLRTPGTQRWPMRYGQLAPRGGLAYRLRPWDAVLRVGVGAFYDPGLGSAVDSANFNPLTSWQYVEPASPQPVGAATHPNAPATLYLPRVWEWRTSLEKSIRGTSVVSLSYLGSSAQHLLRTEGTIRPGSAILQSLQFTSHAASSYNALLAQFRGNITPHWYALLSYTYAHSIDTGSSDTGVFLTGTGYNSAVDRGSSNFDVRHTFAGSLAYHFPKFAGARLSPFLREWNLSASVQARSGFPFDVTSVDRSVGFGFQNTSRPDVVSGQPIWLRDANVLGGRVLNRKAFSSVSDTGDGNLGRNVLNGPGLLQVDASLRRRFRLYRESGIEFSVSAFNLLNRRSYSSPVGFLGSALFGQPTSAASLQLGSGSPTGGLTPIYQAGAPRTVEVGLRFGF